jgi:probable rRNA maturation factor
MSLIVDLQIKNPGRYAFNRERLFGVVERVLVGANNYSPEQRIMVSLLIANREQMAKYNWLYHETKGPTDVLSFPYTDPESQVSKDFFATPPHTGIILGDLIVCYPIAREIGLKEGKSTQEMLEFYVSHGLHHLLGHHHE